ncbi:nucleoside triphosphate pyrophosphohydrolase family protein [Granulicatella seriolae]|uniref:NTP pyrophosphohydrolase MazG putative catalytic core domain-containing protein n=1 Tax=Granulicatella seriolae TaxID=2967226 RepID=A0ABT1WMI3_9LACT|nr:hypothetical protein [Granulicatella seriolae]
MELDLNSLQKRILDNKKNHGFNTTDIKVELLLLYGEVNELFLAYLKKDEANMGEELADIAIFLLGISEMLHVDLGEEVLKKMDINEKRVYGKAGKKTVIE